MLVLDNWLPLDFVELDYTELDYTGYSNLREPNKIRMFQDFNLLLMDPFCDFLRLNSYG